VFSFPHLLLPRFQLFSLIRLSLYQDIFLIRLFIYLVYIKPLVFINKQFSIDSFSDAPDLLLLSFAFQAQSLSKQAAVNLSFLSYKVEWVKDGLASYFLRFKSMLGSDQGPYLPD